jgi:hypothetical protein
MPHPGAGQRDRGPPALAALGLPASWEKYAGHDYWDSISVRHDPLFSRYAGQLTDVNIAQFLLTHPGSILGVGQHAAILAQHFRVTTLGNYPPSAGQPPGASETRVVALTWLIHLLPPGWGLWWLIPLWAAMVAVGVGSLRRRRDTGWQRDGGILVLSMTACAIAAFIPPAYFAGISTTRHMVGMNVATALAFSVSVALAVSMIHQLSARARFRHPPPPKARVGQAERHADHPRAPAAHARHRPVPSRRGRHGRVRRTGARPARRAVLRGRAPARRHPGARGPRRDR